MASAILVACGNDEGAVRFYKVANTDFAKDHLAACSSDDCGCRPEEWRWMRDHYARMQVYAPWFDCQTDWYREGLEYKDLYAIYNCPEGNCTQEQWDTYWHVTGKHPEWILVTPPDDSGATERLFIKFPKDPIGQIAADIGNPAFREYWIAREKATLKGGYYRGIFVDDVNLDLTRSIADADNQLTVPLDPRTGVAMTPSDWERYVAEFTEEIRDAFPDLEIVHNSVWFHEEDWNNKFLQRQVDAADCVMLERGANDPNFNANLLERFLDFNDGVHARKRAVIHLCRINPVDSSPGFGEGFVLPPNELAQLEYGLAGWMLISEGGDLYGSTVRSDPDNWWGGFDSDLGRAVSDRFDWMGVRRRDFEKGVVLMNGPDGGVKRLSLGKSYRTLGGGLVHEVTLRSRTAAILRELPGFQTKR